MDICDNCNYVFRRTQLKYANEYGNLCSECYEKWLNGKLDSQVELNRTLALDKEVSDHIVWVIAAMGLARNGEIADAVVKAIKEKYIIAPKDWRDQIADRDQAEECPVCGEWW